MFLEALFIKTYDFSTLYTSLELDAIYKSLVQLILRMFKNRGSVGILVNSESKKAFWSDGSDRPDYKLYDLDKLYKLYKL